MGLPRAFDEEQVLDAARDASWARGYEATSTRERVKASCAACKPASATARSTRRSMRQPSSSIC